MRSWGLVTVSAGAIAGLFLAAVPAVAADHSNAGSIKVKSHADPLYPPENDPHVTGCPASFDVYAYVFSNQNVSWTIDQQAPTGTAQVAAGNTVLTPTSPTPPEGARYQGYLVYGMTLPSGHYKVVAHEVGTNATGKQKVFWIASDCPSPSPSATPTPTPTATPTPTPTVSPSPTPAVVPTATPTPNGGVGAGSTPTPTPAGGVSGGEAGGAAGAANGSGAQGGVLAETATAGAVGAAGATGAVLADTGLPIAGGALGGLILLIGAGMLAVRRRLNLS